MEHIDILNLNSMQLNEFNTLEQGQKTNQNIAGQKIGFILLEKICIFMEEIYQEAERQYQAAQQKHMNRIWQQYQQKKLLEQFYHQVFLVTTKYSFLLNGLYKLAFHLSPVDLLFLAIGQQALKWVKPIPEWITLNAFRPKIKTTPLPKKNTEPETAVPVLAEAQLIVPENCILTQNHYQELLNSALDPEIAALNFKSLDGNSAFERITANINFDRRNDGRLTDKDMRKYSFLFAGGWWCSGINILTMTDSFWGCFKPDTPRINHGKNKPIKYEHPHKTPTEIFCLKVPPRIWASIANRYNVFLPDNYETLPPASFWQWVIDNNLPIIITEGAKKAAALLSLGYIAIGLPGISNGYRIPRNEDGEVIGEPRLIAQLKPFATPQRQISFCFDQDSKPKTLRNVNIAIHKTAKLFLKSGCQPSVIIWNRDFGKGIDDAIVNGVDFDSLYNNAPSLDEWEIFQSRKLILYDRNLQLNQRYLGNIPLPEQPLIAIRSPKNTGKTHLLESWTDEILHSGKTKVLIISHRVILGRDLGNKLGVPHISEIKHCPEGRYFGMSLNIDSLHPKSQARFNPQDWRGAYLILDEVVQLFRHLFFSCTCTKKRVLIMKNLRTLVQTIVQSGGKILIADADLNDGVVNYIKTLADLDSSDIFLMENTYKFDEKWDIHTFNLDTPIAVIHELDTQLQQQKKCFVCLSSQNTTSQWSSQNLESRYRQMFPDLKILRIDADTVHEPNHPAYNCVYRLNEILLNYDLVLTTSVIETGVSIEFKHFDSVFGIFLGVQTTDSVRQHLSRYRPCVPRYIWAKPVGINRIGNGSINIKQLLSAEHMKDKANINRLLEMGFEESIDGNFEPLALKTWALLAAIDNYGMWHYRQQIYHDLADEGHNLIEFQHDIPLSELEDLKSQIQDVSETNYELERRHIAEQESISDEKFHQLEKKQSKTAQERLEYKKGLLERKYLVPVTPELVKKDHQKWSQKITLDYYLSLGRDFVLDRDKQILLSALEHGNGHYFKPDTNKLFLGQKIHLLNVLNIPQLLKTEEISNLHPLLIDFDHQCNIYQYDIKLHLGIDVRKYSTPIRRYQVLIALCGYKLPELRKKGRRGQQVRIYGAAAPDFVRDEKGKVLVIDGKPTPVSDMRELVFESWLRRDIAAREKANITSMYIQQSQPDLISQDEHVNINSTLNFIREFLNKLDWGGLNTFLASISLSVQQAVWEKLTTEEKEYLLQLQPMTPLEKIIKPLLDQIKNGANIKQSLFAVNLFLATCTDQDKIDAYYLTPYNFRHLLVF